MNCYIKTASNLMNEMEDLLSKDDELSYEEDERLNELYQEVKENLENASNMILGTERYDEKEERVLQMHEKWFKEISSQYETPDQIRDSIMDNMFPDEDSEEGFDWTLE